MAAAEIMVKRAFENKEKRARQIYFKKVEFYYFFEMDNIGHTKRTTHPDGCLSQHGRPNPFARPASP
jgi:hypothetical protein